MVRDLSARDVRESIMDLPKTAVALVTDAGYFIPSVAAAASVLRHAPTNVEVLIVCDRCAPDERQRAWASERAPRLRFMEVDLMEKLAPRLGATASDPTVLLSPLGRLLLPELFPDVERFIYLDGDVLCSAPFDVYLGLDLRGHAVAAAHDNLLWSLPGRPTMPKSRIAYREAISVPLDVEYFNSGVMIMDAEPFRQKKIARHTFDYFSSNVDACRFNDQSAMNAVMRGGFLPLSPRFNWQEAYQGLIPHDEASPVFVHFSGGYKPWSAAHHFYPSRYRAEYERLLQGFPGAEDFLQPAGWDRPIFRKAVRKALRRILKLRTPRYGVPILRRDGLRRALLDAIDDARFPDME